MTKKYDWGSCVTGSIDVGKCKILECIVLQATKIGKNYFQLVDLLLPFLALPSEISVSLVIISYSFYFIVISFIITGSFLSVSIVLNVCKWAEITLLHNVSETYCARTYIVKKISHFAKPFPNFYLAYCKHFY